MFHAKLFFVVLTESVKLVSCLHFVAFNELNSEFVVKYFNWRS
ncbi:hypothetical protein ECDEC6C_1721 [Escherichia coli DEC6C]|nr:hypothetical protein ECDEC6C_1721 [Escherichia coli DEC6C]